MMRDTDKRQQNLPAAGVNSVSSGERVVGVEFSTLALRPSLDRLVNWVGHAGRPRYFACVNPHSVMTARRDPEFAAALGESALNTADGVGIVVGSRLLGGRIVERVCGPDLFEGLCARLNVERPGTRMFFLGATDATLGALVERFRREFPALVVAGTLAPPFRPSFTAEDEHSMAEAVNTSRADVLWIGLGAPKQEKLARRLRDRLEVRLIGPVGGVFDFYSGRVKLPPRWMQRAGLIWLYRFCQQPKRLFRRNLDSPLFLACVLRQRMGLLRAPAARSVA